MPIVSVIISVYNTDNPAILRSSIDSILLQTFNDIEVIICDDGSADRTFETLTNMYSDNSKVVILRNKANLGSAAARNYCISMSNGEFIAIMDADDYSSLDRLEKQVYFLTNNPQFDFVGSKAALFDEQGIWGYREYKTIPENRDFLFVLPFVHASVTFRRSVLTTVGGYRIAPETVRTEDYDLFMRLYANGMKGFNLNEVLYFVREDKSLYRRRKYRHKINEAVVRYKGFKDLQLLPKGFLYIVKPLLVGLLPIPLLNKLKDKYYKRRKGR